MYYSCISCGERSADVGILHRCPRCGDLLEIQYDYDTQDIPVDIWEARDASVWRYRELLPIKKSTRIVTLKEGGTPLYECRRIGKDLQIKDVYVKNEGENPTGSFKDRGMTVAVTKVVEVGGTTVTCASTGNTSASLAAYAARAGLRCIIFIPEGKIALGKLVQAVAHGAEVIQLQGNFDEALEAALAIVELDKSVFLLNSINPFRVEGQKTLAFEICSQLGYRSPDVVIIPVGNAGNITSLWKGFKEFKRLHIIDELPRIIGVQAEGASPIAEAFHGKLNRIERARNPETVATAIRIGNPVNWKRALAAAYESHGAILTVSDVEILKAQRYLASREGVFVEPASASSIAYLEKGLEDGQIGRDEEVVCVTTGHGLKDPDIVLNRFKDLKSYPPDVKTLQKVVQAKYL